MFLILFIATDFVSIRPGYSNEFSWISIWPLVKPHADCSVAYWKHFYCVLHTIGWIVSIVTCELGERFETDLIKASKFFWFAIQSFKIFLICVSIQSFRNQIATKYTICASLYCSHAKQTKHNLMSLNNKQKSLCQMATT